MLKTYESFYPNGFHMGRVDPELSGGISLLFCIRSCNQKADGGPGALGRKSLIDCNKNLRGKIGREDPELSRAISLAF